jgi:oxygen-dependent protoporphyrinogen oxidase
MTRADLVVVGGGITGLAAAWEAHQRGADVVVLEADSRPGGKLRTSDVGGIPVDESADAFLARRPEAVKLCAELGIEDELVAPGSGRAFVWIDEQLRPLPEAQLLGVPTDLDALATDGILSPAGLARARDDLVRPDDRPDGDESVGALIRRRLGDEVLDRLVAPLVGGIWAGDCDRLSLDTATPALADARREGPSLIQAAAALREAASRTNAEHQPPVFLAPRDGMGRLVEALSSGLGDRVRAGQAVTAIEPSGASWRIDPAAITADAVVVALPAWVAAPLIRPHSAAAGTTLAQIDHASVALITLAVPRRAIDHPLDGSGFLVPHSAGRTVTACSWTSSKWPHLGGDKLTALVRASVGWDGADPSVGIDRPDDELVAAVLADLEDLMNLHGPPEDVRISRWVRSFPQPRPGHLARVATLEADLARDAPGLFVAGAWARGVGIPACIQSGRSAAAKALGR